MVGLRDSQNPKYTFNDIFSQERERQREMDGQRDIFSQERERDGRTEPDNEDERRREGKRHSLTFSL